MCFSSVWKWINWQIKLYSQEWLFCPTQASDFCWVSFHSSVNCHQSEGFAPRPFSSVCFLLGLFLFPASLFLENAYIHALSTMIGSYVWCVCVWVSVWVDSWSCHHSLRLWTQQFSFKDDGHLVLFPCSVLWLFLDKLMIMTWNLDSVMRTWLRDRRCHVNGLTGIKSNVQTSAKLRAGNNCRAC